MPDVDDFEARNRRFVDAMGQDEALREATRKWFELATRQEYSYHFEWLGRPIIQFPQDLMAMQELIWRVRPEVIVETGVARGGSLIFYASMLELLGGDGRVIGIDIDIRRHNRQAIDAHPMRDRIEMLEGSSVAEDVVARVHDKVAGRPALVALDSLHTHEHVLGELRAYAPLVRPGGYLVVFDTIIEFLPADFYPDRPWSHGNNPWSALQAFLCECDRFEIDRSIPDKLQITVAPDGYLKCVKD